MAPSMRISFVVGYESVPAVHPELQVMTMELMSSMPTADGFVITNTALRGRSFDGRSTKL